MTIKWFQVGKIVNTHGINGEVRVISETDFKEERFAIGNKLYIRKAPNEKPHPYIVTEYRRHKQFDLLKFKGYLTINDVEPLKGAYIFVNEEQLIPLKNHEYYYHEIIGCEVYTVEDKLIGTIKDILSPGANDVWVIKTKGKDVLIPYIEDVVKDVDVVNRKVKICLMDGLI